MIDRTPKFNRKLSALPAMPIALVVLILLAVFGWRGAERAFGQAEPVQLADTPGKVRKQIQSALAQGQYTEVLRLCKAAREAKLHIVSLEMFEDVARDKLKTEGDRPLKPTDPPPPPPPTTPTVAVTPPPAPTPETPGAATPPEASPLKALLDHIAGDKRLLGAALGGPALVLLLGFILVRRRSAKTTEAEAPEEPTELRERPPKPAPKQAMASGDSAAEPKPGSAAENQAPDLMHYEFEVTAGGMGLSLREPGGKEIEVEPKPIAQELESKADSSGRELELEAVGGDKKPEAEPDKPEAEPDEAEEISDLSQLQEDFEAATGGMRRALHDLVGDGVDIDGKSGDTGAFLDEANAARDTGETLPAKPADKRTETGEVSVEGLDAAATPQGTAEALELDQVLGESQPASADEPPAPPASPAPATPSPSPPPPSPPPPRKETKPPDFSFEAMNAETILPINLPPPGAESPGGVDESGALPQSGLRRGAESPLKPEELLEPDEEEPGAPEPLPSASGTATVRAAPAVAYDPERTTINEQAKTDALVQDQYARGLESMRREDWKEAIRHFTVALALDDDNQQITSSLRIAREKKRSEESWPK